VASCFGSVTTPTSAHLKNYKDVVAIIILIQFYSIQFWFINVPSQQPDGQLQKQHNIQTQITMDKEQDKIKQTQQNK
jgi:hypothetical protein